MELPKFHETFIPILTLLSEVQSFQTGELKQKVFERYYKDLPEDLLSLRTKSGGLLILNRIGWAKAYLKQAKLIDQPSRGVVRITDKGRKVLTSGKLSLKDIWKDSDFLAYEDSRESQRDAQGELSSDKSPQEIVEAGIHTLESSVKTELLDRLKTIDPYDFQNVILELLDKMGYGEFVKTPKSKDGGIDGIVNRDHLGLEKIFIQAKRFNNNKVREKDIRDFIGALSSAANNGIFVTTSSYDDGAKKKAESDRNHKIELIDGARLVDLMYKFNVGVQTVTTYEFKEIDEDFFERD